VELVGFLLRSFGRGADGMEIGRRLIDEYGSLVALSRMCKEGAIIFARPWKEGVRWEGYED
jgi:DNA repair protein RadC